jgi:hypothetical protein
MSELTSEMQNAGLKDVGQNLDEVGAVNRNDAVPVPGRQFIQFQG